MELAFSTSSVQVPNRSFARGEPMRDSSMLGKRIRPAANRRRVAPQQLTMRAYWVEPHTKEVLTAALEQGISSFMFRNDHDANAWASLGRYDSVAVDEDGRFSGGRVASITSAEDVKTLMSQAGLDEIVVMDSTSGWTAIPAENLIAAFQSTNTKLYAVVQTADDARAMLGMLQVGVEGVVLRTNQPKEVFAFAKLRTDFEGFGGPIPGMSSATVTAIKTVGVGERVCLDTCSLLAEDEGLLIGSSSKALFLVLSEAAKVSYVPSRPFRVNAGPVHSYCLVPGGKTKYLSELCAGDEVLVASQGGRSSRSAVVGRAKIETRPLLLIEAEQDDGKGGVCTLFVQNAETVRVASLNGDDSIGTISVTSLQIGHRLLLKTDAFARHIGIAIEESLIEQ